VLTLGILIPQSTCTFYLLVMNVKPTATVIIVLRTYALWGRRPSILWTLIPLLIVSITCSVRTCRFPDFGSLYGTVFIYRSVVFFILEDIP